MRRNGWYVFIGGVILSLAGAYGMWAGWEHIQLERGWSQFIAGAVAISGGVVTMALGRVIGAISRLSEALGQRLGQEKPSQEKSADASVREASRKAASQAPAESFQTEALAAAPNPVLRQSPLQPQRQPAGPTEVDRYAAGDAEYVMYSDGSVEVRSGEHTERYPSLAALRAEAARRM